MADFGTGIAADVLGSLLHTVIRQVYHILNLAESVKEMQYELDRVKTLVLHILHVQNRYQIDIPMPVENWLAKVQNALGNAEDILKRHSQEKGSDQCGCLAQRIQPRLSRRIRQWNSNIRKLVDEGNTDFSLICNLEIIMSMSQKPSILLDPTRSNSTSMAVTPARVQPRIRVAALNSRLRGRVLGRPQGMCLSSLPELVDRPESPVESLNRLPSVLKGTEIIQAAVSQLRHLLLDDEGSPVIGVYGAAGIGKSWLLKSIYNSPEVNQSFDLAILATDIPGLDFRNVQYLRSSIVDRVNSQLPKGSMMKLLFMFDDMANGLDLCELIGIFSGRQMRFKIVFATRSLDLCRTIPVELLGSIIEMKTLCYDEGWGLFCRGAFGGDDRNKYHAPPEIEEIARQMAEECKGLPLAINVVATAMKPKTDPADWLLALTRLKAMESSFDNIHSDHIDKDLFRLLKWSYDSLPRNLKLCFLYCAVYPKNRTIDAENLIGLWISEGLVTGEDQDGYNSIDRGFNFLQALADRCFIEISEQNSWNPRIGCRIKMHNVLRDFAMYIGETEENFLFRAGQNLHVFPHENSDHIAGCRRISVAFNSIDSLPMNLECPNLLSLVVTRNDGLREIPESFLFHLTSLRTLDLSGTAIESLPASIGQLKLLVSLQLRDTKIKELPEAACNLSKLQMLDLSYCRQLRSLPLKLSGLISIRDLNLCMSENITFLPIGISQLTSLECLDIYGSRALDRTETAKGTKRAKLAASLKDLAELGCLRKLRFQIKSPAKVGVMGRWVKMRDLELDCGGADQERLPDDMQAMKDLQIFGLCECNIQRLPSWICGFEKLLYLNLNYCVRLTELRFLEKLPSLKVLSIQGCLELKELGVGFGRADGFPKLQELHLSNLPNLESIAGPLSMLGEGLEVGALSSLAELSIMKCENLKRFPLGSHTLKSLKVLRGDPRWWDGLIWEDDIARNHLQRVYVSTLR